MLIQWLRRNWKPTILLSGVVLVWVASARSAFLVFVTGWPTFPEAINLLRRSFFDLSVVSGEGLVSDGFAVFVSVLAGFVGVVVFAGVAAVLDNTFEDLTGRNTRIAQPYHARRR